MFSYLRNLIPDRHPIRLLYHKFVAAMAAVIYGFPAKELIVVGVTGTNGKTSTVNMITSILHGAGEKVGMTSTIRFRVGDEQWSNVSKQTTMGRFGLQKILRRMVKAGCKYAILEVSSHAMTQSRVLGINIDVAVITNVTPEHVEYHGSFDAYLRAKGQLFKKVSRGRRKKDMQKVLVLNAEDENFEYFDSFVADRKFTYGLDKGIFHVSDLKSDSKGSEFILHMPNEALPVSLKMPGRFNVYNALAASAVCVALGLSIEQVKKGLDNLGAVPGRYEIVNAGQDFTVVVDYAHDVVALKNLFSTYKKLTEGRLFVVFGATGGGRDKHKRPEMGKVAHKYADYIVLTNDDPYTEDEYEILDQISEGVERVEGDSFWKIPDRKEAICLALSLAQKGDSVIVSGKGCEEVMMLRGKRIKWNDRDVIEELIGKL